METDSQVASEHALAEHIRGERVRFVFIQSALPIVFSPLAALILSVSLWDVAKLLGDTTATVERVYGPHCPDHLGAPMEATA